ncbi:MAG: CoA transferase [Chloroflexi bacterium]|nr:CoA transferase [Chloroflexota bacterium]
MPDQALSGIRVLDLTHYVAGAYCTKLLGDYGAEVIKVERPGHGDDTRRLGPFLNDIPDIEGSGLFLHLNTNKKSVTLNLKSKRGKSVFRDLVKDSDIVAENFSPRVMPSLRLPFQGLREVNPALVMTSISSFGSTGPYSHYRATDLVEYAMSGWMYPMGEPARPPLQPGGPFVQYVAGLYAAIGTLMAHHWATATGEGQRVEVAIHEAAVSLLVYDTVTYSHTGQVRERKGHRFTLGGPGNPLSSVQPCKDGYIVLVVGRRLTELFQLIGRTELRDDPKFSTPEAVTEHADEFEELLRPWLLSHTMEEIFHTAQRARIPIAMVPTAGELLDFDQHKAREYYVEVEHPQAGAVVHTGPPFRMSATPWQVSRPAPRLGEHNEEVYSGRLGYSRKDMETLRAERVI